MEEIHHLKLEQLVSMRDLSRHSSVHGNDYLYCHITGNVDKFIDAISSSEPSIFKFDGIHLLLCNGGTISFNVNLSEVTMSKSDMTILNVDDLLDGASASDDLDLSILVVGREFLRDLNFNIQVFDRFDFLSRNLLVTHLEPKDYEAIQCYLKLLDYNAEVRHYNGDSDLFTRSIARNLVASVFYHYISLRSMHKPVVSKPASRRTAYIFTFIQLVHTHYRKERTIKFYADKLFISPKYLSLIVKEGTGRTAAEWIDACVIMEAKNLLRFSGMNVQQVAYELNFSNQSSFGKYFKHLAGMSPSQFQKS